VVLTKHEPSTENRFNKQINAKVVLPPRLKDPIKRCLRRASELFESSGHHSFTKGIFRCDSAKRWTA
jgi:hypothetical protein